jgi:hypothetical protein
MIDLLQYFGSGHVNRIGKPAQFGDQSIIMKQQGTLPLSARSPLCLGPVPKS